MGYRLSVDVGGTFTDVVLFDEYKKAIHVTKTSSTPRDYSEGIIRGIKKIVEKVGLSSLEDINYFIHGTTVATNALLERKGAKCAVVTTEGFRDVLEIGRQVRPEIYDFWSQRPKPPVPRHLIFEVPERILFDGEVAIDPDENVVRAIAAKLRKAEVESIAVCFLHSYLNSSNEDRVKAILAEEMPGIYICTSSEILPEIREYERFSTATVNAYLMPRVEEYIKNLETKRKKIGISVGVHVMQSNGGIMSASIAAKRSVYTVFSGPAGGVLAAMYLSKLLNEDKIITLDIGGTSTDLALIEDKQAHFTSEVEVGGFPIRVPMIEMHTIGAGGGSIAWADAGGAIRVGPQSAGASPGPACYGSGGELPTVTDANLLLGRINPDFFLGGEITLSVDKAISAVESKIGSVVGLTEMQSASGIVSIINSNMCGGINVVSTQKGYDLREFSLIAFGGAGALHAAELADELGMKRVVVPVSPGNFSAVGAQMAQIRYDFVRTSIKSTQQITVVEYNQMYKEMSREALDKLSEEGFSNDKVLFITTADMRYMGQAWELTVPTQLSLSTAEDLAAINLAFARLHRKQYGYTLDNVQICFVNLRLSAIGTAEAIEFTRKAISEDFSRKAMKGKRKVWIDERYDQCPVYDRDSLTPGNRLQGPAIIEEYASTTWVPTKFVASVDKFRNLILQKEG